MAKIIKPADLIPGHVYLDKNGTELIYLGYGTYKRFVPGEKLYDWGRELPEHLYMKKLDVDNKISDGRLAADFSVYNGHTAGNLNCSAPDFFKTVFFSKKTRPVIEDLGVAYPPGFFNDITIKDITHGKTGLVVYWRIQASILGS